jgi:glycosyltransferase involved in cell wall biosynthesis
MRILFVAPELPNQFHRIRALNLLRGLRRLDHEVDLISLTHREPRPADLEPLGALCRQVEWEVQPLARSLVQSALGLVGSAPLEVCYERSPKLAALVRRRLAERSYDVLYIKRLRMAEYGLNADSLPRILDLTDSMERFYDQAWRRAPLKSKLLFWEEWLKYRAYEPRVSGQFERCVVCSPADAGYLREHSGLSNVDVVANAVDTEYFAPREGVEEPATFLLSGLMDKLVNVDAALYLAHEIWPRVRAQVPNARLRLVGPKPAAAIRALDGRDGIEVVGLVPDLRDEIARATVTLVPLRVGTGTKNKVIQSLAMARPVVTTTIGNEGLEADSGQEAIVADDPATFADAVIRVHGDPALRAELGRRGRVWVEAKFGIDVVAEQLRRTLAAVVNQRAGTQTRDPAGAP